MSIFLLSIVFNTGFAQTRLRIDSFSQILSREREDTLRLQILASKADSNRVILLHDFYYTILFSRPDSAMYIAQEGLKLAQEIGFQKGEALCKTDIGGVWWIIGDYSKANEVLLDGLKIAESINDPFSIEWAFAFLLSNSRDQGNHSEAVKFALRGAEIHRVFSDTVWNVIIASVYEEMNRLDLALHYLQKGDSGDYNSLIFGHTYAKMGKHQLASAFYQKAISDLSKHNNLKDLADAYIGLASLYEKEDKPDSAIYYAQKGLAIAQTASFKKWVFETNLILSRIYEKKDAGLSLHYYKSAMAAKDSMFNLQKATESLSSRYNEQMRQKEVEAAAISNRNKIRTYALLAALGFFLVLAIVLYRNNRDKQRANVRIEKAYRELKTTQSQLIQSEKMASLGELTAGIAHEIQNPLNFINNFSEVNMELTDELKQELDKGNTNEAQRIAVAIIQNEEKILHHGKRADGIVKSMLQHSRTNTGQKELTDINALADEYLRLAYHGLRAKDKSFNAGFKTDFDKTIEPIRIIPQEIGRVLLNLINNAFYAVTERKKTDEKGYEPLVTISTRKLDQKVEISVSDNGIGIPPHLKDKIFQPFFTTKPTGLGTGLGLSLSYDIVRAHGGELSMETKQGEGSEFTITLPYV